LAVGIYAPVRHDEHSSFHSKRRERFDPAICVSGLGRKRLRWRQRHAARIPRHLGSFHPRVPDATPFKRPHVEVSDGANLVCHPRELGVRRRSKRRRRRHSWTLGCGRGDTAASWRLPSHRVRVRRGLHDGFWTIVTRAFRSAQQPIPGRKRGCEMTCSPPPQGGVQWPVGRAVACGECGGLWGVQWPVVRAVACGACSGLWCVLWHVGRAVTCGAVH